MIGIARLLLKKGYKISGSDITDSSELRKLRKDGAKVFIGHSKENIKDANLVVVSSAIDKRILNSFILKKFNNSNSKSRNAWKYNDRLRKYCHSRKSW